MASVSMSLSFFTATNQLPSSGAFLKPLPQRSSKAVFFNSKSKANFKVEASLKERALTGMIAAAATASMVLPEVAQAASSDFTPSLKNFLLSITAGGVVLTAILGAVIGVSNFDPVKRS
ncbi:hypothetical protein LIER_24063 [Lithospermum erythrorhizon]|uniref:Ultraviolet-B-repressible protein n=1 Tax=Lithospermum erythrorhizon TaxID=34254 RepID=A0AAV3R5F3_LITER